MYAVVSWKGKQYIVTKGEPVLLDLQKDAAEGSEIKFTEVNLVADGDKIFIGKPSVKEATVVGKVTRNPVVSRKGLKYWFRKRVNYRRRRGYRQFYTEVEIQDITVK